MAVAVEPTIVPRLLTVDDAIRMSEVGILGEEERVELVDGVLVRMSPEGQRHLGLVTLINGILVPAYAPGYGVSVQCTLRLHEHGYRIPDFVVSDAPLLERPPRPDEIALVVEVADSSLSIDLRAKPGDYSTYGVPAYWVVDVRGRRLIVHSGPQADRYADVRTLTEEAEAMLPRTDLSLAVARLLPPAATG